MIVSIECHWPGKPACIRRSVCNGRHRQARQKLGKSCNWTSGQVADLGRPRWATKTGLFRHCTRPSQTSVPTSHSNENACLLSSANRVKLFVCCGEHITLLLHSDKPKCAVVSDCMRSIAAWLRREGGNENGDGVHASWVALAIVGLAGPCIGFRH